MKKSTPRHSDSSQKSRSNFSLRLFILVVIIGLIAPFSYVGLAQLYTHYVEISAPEIELLEIPRGIGMAPVTLRFRLKDSGAGLDEVVVRTRQRGRVRELLRSKLKGVAVFEQEIPFAGAKSNFQEGAVDIEIVAFDRAFWSNRTEKTLQLRVDYHKPKIEVLTTQHNARRGGSQLVFYRVFDEDIALSGVKVGNRVFQGFRASGLDPAFEDPNLYVVFYAIDLAQNLEQLSIRVFAEDQAGNGISTDFYNKVLDRPTRQVTLALTEEFLRTSVTRLFEQNSAKLVNYADQFTEDPFLVDLDPLAKKFRLLNEILRRLNQTEITNYLDASPRFESFLKQFFLRQPGTSRIQFGDQISYSYADQIVSQSISIGNEFSLPQNQGEVVAVNDGIVSMAENSGVYGRFVVIDHGLGVASLYGNMEEIKFHKGESIKRGEAVGIVGKSGLSLRPAAYVEMRVHGVPVDPLEWWDPNWFNQHIVGKMDDMKRLLGLQVTKPLTFGSGL